MPSNSDSAEQAREVMTVMIIGIKMMIIIAIITIIIRF